MITRVHRWRKRLLLSVAALPLCQAVSGCDAIVGSAASQLLNSTFSTFIGSIHQVLLQNFPSADVLQVLLGASRQPFFSG